MISATLDSIKEDAARILREYTNGALNARLAGAKNAVELESDCMNVVYLHGVLDYVYLIGETPYLGTTAITDADVLAASQKLWHYSGRFANVDLSGYTQITSDDGDGGTTDPSSPTTEDHYRSGSVAVTSGSNIVTFVKNGVVSPLPSADYTVVMWVTLSDGSIQRNLVPTTKTAGGFVVSDVLGSGVLEYQATLDT